MQFGLDADYYRLIWVLPKKMSYCSAAPQLRVSNILFDQQHAGPASLTSFFSIQLHFFHILA